MYCVEDIEGSLDLSQTLLIENEIAMHKSCFFFSNPSGIPYMVVLTNVDKACPLVRKDIKTIYRSKHVQEKVSPKSK